MRLIHLSDLHLGKTIYGVSLIDSGDQICWADEFLKIVREIQPDAVLIAGDVYDRSAPSGEAVLLFDHLLTGLASMEIPVLIVAGNHDSGERLSFAGELLEKNQVYLSGILKKKLSSVTVYSKDKKDRITFWLLPYIFPALVSTVLEDDTIRDYETAVRRLIAAQDIDFSEKNVLIAHQNVTANGKEVERGGSETMVGGVGQIDYTAFDGFTYVALGHIHAAYAVGREEVRYCGTPLYYHFSELRQPQKGPLLVEIESDGAVKTELLPISPLHPMREIRGTYEEIRENLEQHVITGEYLRIVISDQRITPEISGYLHELCGQRDSILMELTSENTGFASAGNGMTRQEIEETSVEELFARFYTERRGEQPDEKEWEILCKAGEILCSRKDSREKEPTESAIDALLQMVLEQEDET